MISACPKHCSHKKPARPFLGNENGYDKGKFYMIQEGMSWKKISRITLSATSSSMRVTASSNHIATKSHKTPNRQSMPIVKGLSLLPIALCIVQLHFLAGTIRLSFLVLEVPGEHSWGGAFLPCRCPLLIQPSLRPSVFCAGSEWRSHAACGPVPAGCVGVILN